jgi:hypothetical protein
VRSHLVDPRRQMVSWLTRGTRPQVALRSQTCPQPTPFVLSTRCEFGWTCYNGSRQSTNSKFYTVTTNARPESGAVELMSLAGGCVYGAESATIAAAPPPSGCGYRSAGPSANHHHPDRCGRRCAFQSGFECEEGDCRLRYDLLLRRCALRRSICSARAKALGESMSHVAIAT